jgi:hypothetical protein
MKERSTQVVQFVRVIRLIESVKGSATAREVAVALLTLPVVPLVLPANED